MRYISTRRGPNTPTRSFSDILLEGLAPDGGLYLPEEYPTLSRSDLDELRIVLREDGYAAMAAGIISLFVDDIPAEDLSAITARAYRTPSFSDPQIVPVDALEGTDLHIAHLSNGPTAAFKDMAMQLLGELFEYELTRRGDWLTIVGATSGDTGSSAEYAPVSYTHLLSHPGWVVLRRRRHECRESTVGHPDEHVIEDPHGLIHRIEFG